MAAAPPKPTQNWADDDDDVTEQVSSDLPPPQTIDHKNGTKTVITYYYNEQGQKVKKTQLIRLVTRREIINPRVAARARWPKFGLSAKDPAGPQAETTSVGENIILKLSPNWKKESRDEAKDPNANALKDKLKDKKVKCRICNGEHFTARCPYKDTMAPVGETAAGDVAAGMGDDLAAASGGASAAGAGAGKKGSYVPPAMRNGGGTAAAGERMGGKYGDRDDLATLRVTNVSEMAEEQELRDMFERFGRVTRVFLAKDRETGVPKGFAFISFADRDDAVKACAKIDGLGYKHLILRVEFAKKGT